MADAPKPGAPAKPAGGKPAGGKPGGGKGGKGKAPVKAAGGRRALYQLEGGSVKRLRRACPKCGPGIFLAEHANRFACGNCHYTEFKK
jgi:ubiquitin-small subunit ribosomal protein S27Ae